MRAYVCMGGWGGVYIETTANGKAVTTTDFLTCKYHRQSTWQFKTKTKSFERYLNCDLSGHEGQSQQLTETGDGGCYDCHK